MKNNTRVAAQFESVGKPDMTQRHPDLSIAELPKAFYIWLTQTYMGHYMRVTIARNDEELSRALLKSSGKSTPESEDIMAELEALIAQESLEFSDVDPEPSLLGDSE